MTCIRSNMEKNGYLFLSHIGRGGTCDVWTARSLATDVVVAIKVMEKVSTCPELDEWVARELDVHKRLNHPFIVKLFDYFEDAFAYYLVQEYVEQGSFLDFINISGPIDEPIAKKHFAQLLCALKYLHQENLIMHRDIKCENCLLDRYNNLKLVDFGTSNTMTKKNLALSTICGSPGYMSPEIVRGLPYTVKTDIWSAGVFLYAALCQCLPFSGESIPKTQEKVLYADPVFPESLSEQAIDLLTGMLKKNPDDRLSLDQIIQHPWFDRQLFSQYDRISRAEQGYHVSIARQMEEIGMFSPQLESDIRDCKWTPEAAVYRMFSRMESNALLHPKRIQAARVEQSLLSLPVLEPCVKYRNTKRSAFNTFGGSNQAVLNSTSRLPKPCLLGAKDGNPRFIMRHHLKRFRTRD